MLCVESTIDTGCSWTLAGPVLLRQLRLSRADLDTSQKKIVLADGSEKRLDGSLKIFLTIGNNRFEHRLEFVESLPVMLLVGLDVLDKIGPVTIDSCNKTIENQHGLVFLGLDNQQNKHLGDENSADNQTSSKGKGKSEGHEFVVPDKIFENSIFSEEEKERIRDLIKEFTDIWVPNNRDALCTLFEGTIPMKRGFEDPVYIPPKKKFLFIIWMILVRSSNSGLTIKRSNLASQLSIATLWLYPSL